MHSVNEVLAVGGCVCVCTRVCNTSLDGGEYLHCLAFESAH